jgi:hypothetical protein
MASAFAGRQGASTNVSRVEHGKMRGWFHQHAVRGAGGFANGWSRNPVPKAPSREEAARAPVSSELQIYHELAVVGLYRRLRGWSSPIRGLRSKYVRDCGRVQGRSQDKTSRASDTGGRRTVQVLVLEVHADENRELCEVTLSRWPGQSLKVLHSTPLEGAAPTVAVVANASVGGGGEEEDVEKRGLGIGFELDGAGSRPFCVLQGLQQVRLIFKRSSWSEFEAAKQSSGPASQLAGTASQRFSSLLRSEDGKPRENNEIG